MKKFLLFGVNLALIVFLILQVPLYAVAVTGETADTDNQVPTDSSKENSEDSNVMESTNENATDKDAESSSSISEEKISVMAANATTTGTWGTVPWSFDSTTGILTFTGGGKINSYTNSPWNSLKISNTAITKIVLTATVTTPASTKYIFSSNNTSLNLFLTNLTTIEGLSYLDLSNATDIEGLFFGASSLKSADYFNLNTSKAKNIRSVFDTTGFTTVDISNWNLKKATNALYLFQNTLNLTSVNISTLAATNVGSMFNNAPVLKSITLGTGFKDTSNSSKLASITVRDQYTGNWTLSSDTTNTSVGTTDQFLAAYDGTKPGTYVWQQQLWGDVPWTFDSTTGTLTFIGGGTLGTSGVSPWNRTDSLKITNTAIKKIIFTQSVSAPANASSLFSLLNNVESIEGLSYLNTDKVTSMAYMFYSMSKITSLDLSNFKTNNVTDMSWMFTNDTNLTELNLSSFDTTNVTNMSNMFGTLSSLKNLSISNFKTNNVTDMSWMFWGSAVPTLNLSNFDTSRVTTMENMFSNSTINNLVISKFDTISSSTKLAYFLNKTSLKSITLGSNFRDTANKSLLPAITANSLYSGNWKYKDAETTAGTSSQFLTNYDGTKPGTYVWESATDPLDPTDTKQTTLTLDTVPTSFQFSTTLKNGSYALTNNLTTNNAITVSNRRLDRDWSVKASVVDTKLTLEKDTTKSLSLQSFSINGQDLLATGSNGVVANSESTKTLDNNVGSLTTNVNSISLGFSDSNGILIAGDNLKGTVRYQLYNTVSAE